MSPAIQKSAMVPRAAEKAERKAKADEAKRSADFAQEVKQQEVDAHAAGRDEEAMREQKAPSPKTREELTAFIDSLASGPHTDGTCVYAVSLAATATFNYMASVMGITGFQADCADMDVLRRRRDYTGPFMVIDGSYLLYPQYDMSGKLDEAIEKWRPWLKDQAQKLLAEPNEHVHPEVRAHWEKLAS